MQKKKVGLLGITRVRPCVGRFDRSSSAKKLCSSGYTFDTATYTSTTYATFEMSRKHASMMCSETMMEGANWHFIESIWGLSPWHRQKNLYVYEAYVLQDFQQTASTTLLLTGRQGPPRVVQHDNACVRSLPRKVEQQPLQEQERAAIGDPWKIT